MTHTPVKNSLILIFCITVCFCVSYGSSEMKDFSLDTIKAQSETRLKVLTNKNIIPPKTINYFTV